MAIPSTKSLSPTWLILVALCSLVPSLAVAQSPADASQTEAAAEAQLQFNLGVNAFRAGNYEQALSHFFISNRLAPNYRLFLNIALCYEQLGKFVEAYRYYDAFSAANDDPSKAPGLNDALARVRQHVALLRVESEPPGATIYLNRKELGSYGTTPRTLAVSPGDYTVILEANGYEPASTAAAGLTVGSLHTAKAPLNRILGKLQLDGTPPGATVEIDDPAGVVTGTLPGTFDLTPGEHIAHITAPGFKTRDLVVVVRPEQPIDFKVDLERQTGALVVQSEERDAQILVDGELVGFTPAVIEALPVGEHKVIVILSGFRPFEKTITIEPDGRFILDARLNFSEDVAAASRVNESVRDAPASVSLISRREIEAMGYFNVSDALQGTRGFFLTNDGLYNFSGVRGFSHLNQYNNRLQVLIDGHTLNESWTGHAITDFALMTHLYDIEQIEVVRGPSSVLYGTSAFFGVVNIITPLPTEAKIRAGVSGVGDGTWRAQATASAPLGKEGSVWVAGGGLVGQGQPFGIDNYFDNNGVERGPVFSDNIGASTAGNGLFRAKWRDLSVQGYFSQRTKTIDNAVYNTEFNDPDSKITERRAYGEVRYEPMLSDVVQLITRLYYDHSRYEGTFDYASLDNGAESFNGQWLGGEARTQLSFAKHTRINAGVEYQYHLQNDSFGHDLNSISLGQTYLDESHPYQLLSASVLADNASLSWMRISAGVRFDGWLIKDLPKVENINEKEDRFLYAISPRLALIFKPNDDSTLKLMGGRAFRAPSIYELTYNDNGVTQIPSPTINSETVWTTEVEYTHTLPADFLIVGSIYLNIINDLIIEKGDGDAVNPLFYENQPDDIFTLGGEVEVRRIFKRGWMLAAQTGLQSTRIGNFQFLDGTERINSPISTSSLKLVVPIVERFLRLGTRLSFETKRFDQDLIETNPALLWDATFSGEDQALGLRYALGVRNLLDWRTDQPTVFVNPTAPPAGRTLTLDISYTY